MRLSTKQLETICSRWRGSAYSTIENRDVPSPSSPNLIWQSGCSAASKESESMRRGRRQIVFDLFPALDMRAVIATIEAHRAQGSY
jgi:hypothetical protein